MLSRRRRYFILEAGVNQLLLYSCAIEGGIGFQSEVQVGK